jgi:hypothetical protein
MWWRGDPYSWYRRLGVHKGLLTAIYAYPKYKVRELSNFSGGQEQKR